MNTNTNRIKQWQEQEALSRFQLIAPLLQEDLTMQRDCSSGNRLLRTMIFPSGPSTAMKRPTVKDSLPA